jgi:hypothetical protein
LHNPTPFAQRIASFAQDVHTAEMKAYRLQLRFTPLEVPMLKSTLQILSVSTLGVLAIACGSSPTAPSPTNGVSDSALMAFEGSSSLDRGIAAKPGNRFCEYPDLQVNATAGGPLLDDVATVFVGGFSGVHRYGTMDGAVSIAMATQHVLRNRHLEIVHDHTFTLADGAFTAAGRSLLRPVSGQPWTYRLRERLPITAGTKIFLDAQGELRLDGTYNRISGSMQYRLTGEICRTGRVPI